MFNPMMEQAGIAPAIICVLGAVPHGQLDETPYHMSALSTSLSVPLLRVHFTISALLLHAIICIILYSLEALYELYSRHSSRPRDSSYDISVCVFNWLYHLPSDIRGETMSYILEVLKYPEIVGLSLASVFSIGLLFYQSVVINGQLRSHISHICDDLRIYKVDTGVLLAEKEREILALRTKVSILEEEVCILKSVPSVSSVVASDGVNRWYSVGGSWASLLNFTGQKISGEIHEIPFEDKPK